MAATSAIGKHRQLRIGQGLGVVGAGAIVGGAAEGLRIGRIDEPHLDALVLQGVGEQVPGAAVEVGGADHVVAGAGEVLHREGRSRLAGGQRQRRHAALQRRHPLLQDRRRRVADAGVDVAQLLQREQLRGVLGARGTGTRWSGRSAAPRPPSPDRRASRRAGRWSRDVGSDDSWDLPSLALHEGGGLRLDARGASTHDGGDAIKSPGWAVAIGAARRECVDRIHIHPSQAQPPPY